MGLDLARLSRSLHALLVHQGTPSGSERAPVELSLEGASRALASSIRRPVSAEDVRIAVTRYGAPKVEIADGFVRLVPEVPRPEPQRAEPSRTDSARPEASRGDPTRRDARPRAVARAPGGPDILYHATSLGRLHGVRSRGGLHASAGAPIHLSRAEPHAWRVAHRQWDDPHVLYVDAARARREGVRIERTRSGHYAADRIPLRHILNLREGFAEQASAGGFLVDWSSGAPRIALIRVTRRGGGTWEVAKGKIEPGEMPAMAATREVREEMGMSVGVRVEGEVGTIRYGFSTPDGSPRLKTIYLYVLEADGPCQFTPARGEGIDEVRWFELQDALDSLAHPSLRGAIGRLVGALAERAVALGLPPPEERQG